MSAIKVGDLVQVVRPIPCCGADKAVGLIAQVVGKPNYNITQCLHCGDIRESDGSWLLSDGKARQAFRLKRIPPLSELEGVKEADKVEA